MSNIATTIEQSKGLIRLGLDPKTADCNWNTTYGEWALCVGKNNLPHAVPAWSLEALLEVMPKYIMKDGVECNIEFWTEGLAGSRWVIGYVGWSRQGQKHIKLVRTTFCKAVGQNLNTAAYEMVCCLLEQGLIKKGGDNA